MLAKSAVGKHAIMLSRPVKPNSCMYTGGKNRYMGIKNKIWRVISKTALLMGWPLLWK